MVSVLDARVVKEFRRFPEQRVQVFWCFDPALTRQLPCHNARHLADFPLQFVILSFTATGVRHVRFAYGLQHGTPRNKNLRVEASVVNHKNFLLLNAHGVLS